MVPSANFRFRLVRLAAWYAVAFLSSLPLALGAESGAVELPQPDGSVLRLDSPASRIVSLSPHLTELVYAAGAGDLLAATVEYSEYPRQAKDLPRVGDAFRIDIERVHLYSPDLILAWQSGNPAAAMAQLADLGFTVWRIEIRDPAEIADVIENIGIVAGTQARAMEVSSKIRIKIKALKDRYGDAQGIPYFYQVAEQPLYTVNGEHLISRALSLCGGRNVFAELTSLAPQVGLEAVLTQDPLLLIGPEIEGQPDPLAHWRSWPRLRAVRNENFLLLPADSVSRATPRFVDAMELACNMMDTLRK